MSFLTDAMLPKNGSCRQFVNFNEMATLAEAKAGVAGRQGEQQENSDPIDPNMSVSKLGAKHSQSLQDVTHEQGFTHVSSKESVVDVANVPQDPTAGQSQTGIQTKSN